MVEWKKVEDAETWDFEEDGKELIGKFVKVKMGVGSNNSNIYTFKLADGTERAVWGSTILDNRLSSLEVGQETKIVFKGRIKSATPGWNPYKDFDVFKKPVEFEEASVGAAEIVIDGSEDVDPKSVPF